MGKEKKKKHKIVLAIMVVALLWVVISFGVSLVGNLSVQTMIASNHDDKKGYETYGFVCVDDTLLGENATGDVIPVKEEGERVAKNRAVFKMLDGNGKENYYYAPCSGLVSYQIDGYEQVKAPSEIGMLDFEMIYTGSGEVGGETVAEDETSADEAEGAQEVVAEKKYHGKIINNMADVVIYVVLPKDEYLLDLELGKSLKLESEDTKEKSYRGKVVVKEDIVLTEGESITECFVIGLNLGVVEESIYLERMIKLRVIYDEKSEMLIPKTALVYRDDEAGVYYLKKKFVVWKDVVVTAEKGEQVVIEGLDEGTEIVVNPNRVTEGKYIR